MTPEQQPGSYGGFVFVFDFVLASLDASPAARVISRGGGGRSAEVGDPRRWEISAAEPLDLTKRNKKTASIMDKIVSTCSCQGTSDYSMGGH